MLSMFSIVSVFFLRGHAQTMWTAMRGGGVYEMSTLPINCPPRGEGGQKSPRNGPHGLCMAPNKA